jgi:hypothetical protein
MSDLVSGDSDRLQAIYLIYFPLRPPFWYGFTNKFYMAASKECK